MRSEIGSGNYVKKREIMLHIRTFLYFHCRSGLINSVWSNNANNSYNTKQTKSKYGSRKSSGLPSFAFLYTGTLYYFLSLFFKY